MHLHQLTVASTPYLLKKKKNNMNSSLKTYVYKEFNDPSHLTQVDSSLFERKMANFAQFKTIVT